MTLKQYLALCTREYIIKIAAECNGKRNATASALGLADKQIQYYINRYNLGDYFGRKRDALLRAKGDRE